MQTRSSTLFKMPNKMLDTEKERRSESKRITLPKTIPARMQTRSQSQCSFPLFKVPNKVLDTEMVSQSKRFPLTKKVIKAIPARMQTRSQTLNSSSPLFKMPIKIESRRALNSPINKPLQESQTKTLHNKGRKATNPAVKLTKNATGISQTKERQFEENRSSTKPPEKQSASKSSGLMNEARIVLKRIDLSSINIIKPAMDINVFNTNFCLRRLIRNVNPNSYYMLKEISSSAVQTISSDESGN